MLRTIAVQRVLLVSLLVLLSAGRDGRLNSFAPDSEMAVVPQTWHVTTTGSDVTGNGSEANPFSTIQHGIDTASHGDTVLVHPGVYRENINFNGKNITVGSLFVTTGDEDYILQTVIDGNRNGHVVTFANGETATAMLNGVTVTNGYAHGVPASGTYGGGVFCNYSSPTMTHLRVTFNEATHEGGGLYFGNCSPTVQDVTVTNNLAGSGGGGIRYSGGSVSLENVVVTHNSARLAGSGIQFYHAEGTIKNALIADNFGSGQGGGLHFDGSSPTFINVTVVGNWTAGHGGGLNVSYMSQPTLVNSIVWGNTPEQIYFDTQWSGEAVTIEYSDIQGGLAGIVTNGQGPVYWGSGNLDASPRFVDVGLGNYHLANDSPGISAGKAAGAPGTDIEGNPRPDPMGSNPDMGAYENPSGSTVSCLKVYLPTISSSLSEARWVVTPGIDLQFPRMRHTATRLLDGKILVVGGSQAADDFLAAVELFDPATGLSSQVASLHSPRHQHTATLLPDGRVLVVGGYSLPWQWLNDAEVYDPVADTWTVVSPPHSHGVEHTATLMNDGRVLVVGGCIGSSLCTDRVDIFNYQTNAWSEAMPLSSDRASHMARLLNDGRVLVAGGGRGVDNVPLGGDALLYNPQTNTWTPTGPMVTSTADLSQVRYQHELVLLEDGQAMAFGGVRDPEHSWTESSFIHEVEIYDPQANCWRIVGNLPQPGANATATLLPDDRVWVTGGRYMGTHWSDTWLIGVLVP